MTSAEPWDLAPDAPMRAVLSSGLSDADVRTATPLTDAAWSDLRRRSGHHRLDGLLVDAVATGRLAVTADQRAAAAEIERDLTRARIWHESMTLEIEALLRGRDIEIRVLKGSALAVLHYPDPQMRPTGDLDLLVRGDQIDAACAALADAGGLRIDPDPAHGYAATVGKGATMAMPDQAEVDLHRLLVWGPFGVRMPPDDLWRASQPFWIGGRRLEALPVEELLLHACYHLLILGWRRALSLRDVLQLSTSPALSADRVLRLARRWGAEAVLAEALVLATTESGYRPVDDGLVAWAESYRPSLTDRLWLRIERPENPIGSLEAIATYAELRTAQERQIFRNATFRPAPGTWAGPGDRVGRVAARYRRSRA